jgi:hypothetical protein
MCANGWHCEGISTNMIMRVAGLSSAQYQEIQGWLEELEGRCSTAREGILASRLSSALERLMGVEQHILYPALLLATRKRRSPPRDVY